MPLGLPWSHPPSGIHAARPRSRTRRRRFARTQLGPSIVATFRVARAYAKQCETATKGRTPPHQTRVGNPLPRHTCTTRPSNAGAVPAWGPGARIACLRAARVRRPASPPSGDNVASCRHIPRLQRRRRRSLAHNGADGSALKVSLTFSVPPGTCHELQNPPCNRTLWQDPVAVDINPHRARAPYATVPLTCIHGAIASHSHHTARKPLA